jgi:hypothetical protein
MKKAVFHIDNDGEHQELTLEDEISFGRSELAQIILPDSGLSRLNTTIFRDGDEVFIVDENSTNGTFVNGTQVFEKPHPLNDRDEITIGHNTNIYVEILAEKNVETKSQTSSKEKKLQKSTPSPPTKENNKFSLIPILAGISAFAIIIFALMAIWLINWNSTPTGGIPVRVHDPLGGVDPDDVEDLIAILDQDIEDEVKDSSTFDEVKTNIGDSTTSSEPGLNLDVPRSVWEEAKKLAMGPRDAPTGTDPPGQQIPPEIEGGSGVRKQTAKLAEMKRDEYQQPMDFADLAQKRLAGDLIELPMATQTFFLDVGGNATEAEFTGFDFNRFNPTQERAASFSDCVFPITPDSTKYESLSRLANNFKYDLNDPRDRQQIRVRLLRMFHPKALKILRDLAAAYYNEFKRPLRVTSLTRSMDYQISLNKNNANSFKVRGPGSLPPHTSGCAFDLSRKQMTAKEQNFVMEQLAKMEKEGILDGLREGGANACFHIFIYDDGIPPKKLV